MPYYLNLEKWFNLYACQLGLGGNTFNNIKLPDIVHHDSCVVKDGVHGVSGGAIYRPWTTGSDYNDEINMSICF